MIYKTFCLQFDALLDFHLEHEDSVDITNINRLNRAAGSIANNAATLVQRNIENERAEITETKSNIKSDGVNTTSTKVKAETTESRNV
jgi:hypothetical protein